MYAPRITDFSRVPKTLLTPLRFSVTATMRLSFLAAGAAMWIDRINAHTVRIDGMANLFADPIHIPYCGEVRIIGK